METSKTVAISAETTVDLTPDLLAAYDIHTMPFQILLGEECRNDGEITSKEIIAFVDRTKVLPRTAAPNVEAYTAYFSKLVATYGSVVHFCLSKEMSGAYNNACLAAETMENVHVIDSRTLSTGIALLTIYAAKLAATGLDAKEVAERAAARVPAVQASFALKRVDYLYKGGRCSALALFGANLMKICPQIIVKDGQMIAGKKYRGSFDKVVDAYCKDTLATFSTPDLEEGFVTLSTADPEVIEIAVRHMKEAGFCHVHVTYAGGTITSHCGENCLGILYLNDGPSVNQ